MASLARGYGLFNKLIIRQGNKALMFNNEQEIAKQIPLKEEDSYHYEFQITDAKFTKGASDADQETEGDVTSGVDLEALIDLLDQEGVGRLRLVLSENQVRTIVPDKPQKDEDVFLGSDRRIRSGMVLP